MPFLASISKIDLPHKLEQHLVKQYAREMFAPSFPAVDRLLPAFDNTGIIYRNFCKPLDSYAALGNFEQRNKEYTDITLEYSIKAIEQCMDKAGVKKEEVTDLVFMSTTGLSTPSLDARIINQMRLPQHTGRIPVFGLGCAGGVSGFAKANMIATANQDAVVLLVAAELCSLTYLRGDYSKSNFISSTLFSDGIAAVLVKGDRHKTKSGPLVKFVAAQSKLYYDSIDINGWEFLDGGFKVLFSQDIPSIVLKNVKIDSAEFLSKHGLQISDIKNFILHPGGTKVLAAYEQALQVQGDFLKNSRQVIHQYGNMSSATVLYVLERFFTGGFEDGYGLMGAMGPGFSNEMVLLQMQNE